jgi:hypothetical protein
MAAIFVGEIIEIAVAEAAEDATVAAELTAATQTSIETEAIAAYNTEIVGSDLAEEKSVTAVYNRLSMIDVEFADQWSASVETKIGRVPIQENPGEPGSLYDDTSPESNPDKTNVTEDSSEYKRIKEETKDPVKIEEDVAEAKANNFQKLWKWAKTNTWKGIKGFFGTIFIFGVAVGVAVLTYVIGGIARLICQSKCGLFKKCVKTGANCGDCQSYNCDCEKYCETSTCQAVKSLVQTVRKDFWYIVIPCIVIFLGVVVWARSIALLIFFTIILLIIWALKSWMGNVVASAVCNWAAFGCAVTKGNATCSSRG